MTEMQRRLRAERTSEYRNYKEINGIRVYGFSKYNKNELLYGSYEDICYAELMAEDDE